ncbi:hypothetical protein [Mycobacterium marinum]|uniref:hypothetical protein n=1 Tax=Mycobacterium marinum TaxID=1781 RepID=UPI0021C45B36|nr:hypothetical protein [Mycobacterium marinum]GJO41975.1 hypothetical protein NJB1604_15100 [Mycobacterium marinum]
MARAAVLTLLRNDAPLVALGGSGFVVVPNFEADQRPNDAGAFIVIAWGVTDFEEAIQDNGPWHFDLYIHWPVALSTDFVRIDDMNDRIDEIFKSVEDGPPVVGGDGRALYYVGFEGRGPDFKDSGYQTICRKASYMALSNKVTA